MVMQMAFDRNIDPFVEPKNLTQEQIKQWAALTQKAMDARKWSVEGTSDADVAEAGKKLLETQISMGDMLIQMFKTNWDNELETGRQVLGWEGVKRARDAFDNFHDGKFGGHLIWDEVNAKANYDFIV